jgi:hypothetical protein
VVKLPSGRNGRARREPIRLTALAFAKRNAGSENRPQFPPLLTLRAHRLDPCFVSGKKAAFAQKGTNFAKNLYSALPRYAGCARSASLREPPTVPHPHRGSGPTFRTKHSFEAARAFVGAQGVRVRSTTGERVAATQGWTKDGYTPTIVFSSATREGSACLAC